MHNSTTVRFQRWSRAGYAVFCSLACCVTIGCVAVSISDKSLQKSVDVSVSLYQYNDSDSDTSGPLETLADAGLVGLQLEDTVVSGNTLGSTDVCAFLLNAC